MGSRLDTHPVSKFLDGISAGPDDTTRVASPGCDSVSAAASIAAMSPELRSLAERRTSDASVAVFHDHDVSHICVVTEDMPHLIDTQIGVITALAVTARAITHPTVRVSRDHQGVLKLTPSACDLTTVESWTDIAVDRISELGAAEVVEALSSALARLAAHHGRYESTRAIVSRASSTARRSGSAEVSDLLDWCASGNMHMFEVSTMSEGSAAGASDDRELEIDWETKRSQIIRSERPIRIRARLDAKHWIEIVGLVSRDAASAARSGIPVVRRLLETVESAVDLHAEHWYAVRTREVVQSLPVPVLMRLAPVTLSRVVATIPTMLDRRRTHVTVDVARDVVSIIVFMPADRCTAENLGGIASALREHSGGEPIIHAQQSTNSGVAVVHLTSDRILDQQIDEHGLVTDIERGLDTWLERTIALTDLDARAVTFPAAYRATVAPNDAAIDLRLAMQTAEKASPTAYVGSFHPARTAWVIRAYRRFDRLALSDVVPVLQSLGLFIVGEQSWPITLVDDTIVYVHHFDVRLASPPSMSDNLSARLEEALDRLWRRSCDTDEFNALLIAAGLDWWQCVLLRALSRYRQQLGSAYSVDSVSNCLTAHPDAARALISLFESRFRPELSEPGRQAETDAALINIGDLIGKIVDRDADRVLRSLCDLIMAVTRTNYFVAGARESALALKIAPPLLADVPAHPTAIEIFVFSAAVEGVHLRFDRIARGGLRWSDRREDYRREILDLATAQSLKNAVVIPAGAKGGFVSRQAADHPHDHYRTFVSALLDVVDNRALDGTIVPSSVVRYEGDDDYLVVAADKGTASFSDVANQLAVDRRYWLGDAFASGGATGYDHKSLGVTARGAWESVRQHLWELGIDADQDVVTVVGIGDMSGDVFGNGMLLSQKIRLVAAFDHRHIFIDPNPDIASSFRERKRLAAATTSTWGDYDRCLISDGGGVWPRSVKSIAISPQMRRVLDVPGDAASMDPPALIRAILQAPVDLLWSAGVGTYVKASHETDSAVGDLANSEQRVDAKCLRVRVIGEGGNLGLTPAARSEYCRIGGRLNSDAIDNSAGVSCSDHEVNLKILLDAEQRKGSLTRGDRDLVLRALTDEVVDLVLAENRSHNVLLSMERARSYGGGHHELIDHLVGSQQLHREHDCVPTPEELAARAAMSEGLTSSELATLLGRTKMAISREIENSTLPADPAVKALLFRYFPDSLRARFDESIERHPLARRIAVSCLTNAVVDVGGLEFCVRIARTTGATWTDAVGAFLFADSVFGVRQLQREIIGLGRSVSHNIAVAALSATRDYAELGALWVLRNRPLPLAIEEEVERIRPAVRALASSTSGNDADLLEESTRTVQLRQWVGAGLPYDLAIRCATAQDTTRLLDSADIAACDNWDPVIISGIYQDVSQRVDGSGVRSLISKLPDASVVEQEVRDKLGCRLDTTIRALTMEVAKSTHGSPSIGLSNWTDNNAEQLETFDSARARVAGDGHASDLARAVASIHSIDALVMNAFHAAKPLFTDCES